MEWYNSWSLREIFDFLDENRLTIVTDSTGPGIKMLDRRYPPPAGAVAKVLPHLKARKADIVEYFAEMELRSPLPKLLTDDACGPHVKPHEARQLLFDTLRRVADAVGGRVAWFEWYTKTTGYVAPHEVCFPDPVSLATAIGTDGKAFVYWEPIPCSTPPKGWKPPKEKPKPRYNPWRHEPPPKDPDALPD